MCFKQNFQINDLFELLTMSKTFRNEYKKLCEKSFDRNKVLQVIENETKIRSDNIGKKKRKFETLWERNTKKIKRNAVSF